jgi:hypothetical protein
MFSLVRLRFVNIIAKNNEKLLRSRCLRSLHTSNDENGRRNKARSEIKTFKCVIADSDCLRGREVLFMSLPFAWISSNAKNNEMKISGKLSCDLKNSIRDSISSRNRKRVKMQNKLGSGSSCLLPCQALFLLHV